MRTRFDEQLRQLNVELIRMGSLCEEAISIAAKFLEGDKKAPVDKVFALEHEMDQLEHDIETRCMRMLLQQQPVARDLRIISAALKMISDMERIGDQAADVAELTRYVEDTIAQGRLHITKMAKAAVMMVSESVEAFVQGDLDLAHKVVAEDDTVDNLFIQVRGELLQKLKEETGDPEAILDLMMIAKYFERIGDHAVNLAEWVEYSITGQHKVENTRIYDTIHIEVMKMIYVLEDDESIRELIIYTLNGQNMQAKALEHQASSGDAVHEKTPSLVLLDIMLPEEDGFSILQKLRAAPATKRLPVIMLTAKGSEYDIVRGLDIGADDYVPKPFRMMELLSRIRALLRCSGATNDRQEEYRVGSLYVNPVRHEVQVDGKDVVLTLKEFELLNLLISRQGIVFTRAQLLDEIWGYGFDGESRTVDVHVRTLRQKLGEAGNYIETVRGIGYKIGGEKS